MPAQMQIPLPCCAPAPPEERSARPAVPAARAVPSARSPLIARVAALARALDPRHPAWLHTSRCVQPLPRHARAPASRPHAAAPRARPRPTPQPPWHLRARAPTFRGHAAAHPPRGPLREQVASPPPAAVPCLRAQARTLHRLPARPSFLSKALPADTRVHASAHCAPVRPHPWPLPGAAQVQQYVPS